MRRWATLADLPVELSEHIILLAARSYALDKAWVAQLTRASRAIHRLVQPILVDTVVITFSNVSRICAASGAFTSTRCLIVDDVEPSKPLRAFLLSTFASVDMLHGPIWVTDLLFKVSRPSRAIITPGVWRGGWTMSPNDCSLCLSRMTHIQGSLLTLLKLLRALSRPSGLDPPLRTTHVFLDRLDDLVTVGTLPIFLDALITDARLSRLQRIYVAVDPVQTKWTSALSAFARAHRETRLWISPAQPAREHDLHTVFDDEHWTAGQQLYFGQ